MYGALASYGSGGKLGGLGPTDWYDDSMHSQSYWSVKEELCFPVL